MTFSEKNNTLCNLKGKKSAIMSKHKTFSEKKNIVQFKRLKNCNYEQTQNDIFRENNTVFNYEQTQNDIFRENNTMFNLKGRKSAL
jgi:nitrous oxide reductase